MPVIGTEAGLPVALLTMLTLADLAPIDGGVNVTMIVQVPLGAMAVLQLLLLEKEGTLAPSRLTELTLSVEVPVLVTVIAWALLEVPSTWLPNGMLVGLSDNVGAAMPVPVRVTTVGLVGALLTMLMLADLAPAPPGVKVTNIVHCVAGSTGVVQLLVSENEGTLAPIRVAELTSRFALPELRTVIMCAVLAVPTC